MKSLFKYIILFFAELPIQMKKRKERLKTLFPFYNLVTFLRRYSSNQAEKGRLLAPFWSITNCCSDRLHFHFALTSPHRTTWRVERPGAAEKGQKETKSGGIQLF
ncbi:hypothetical protein HMPREF1141_3334 [Clostridium sp. MSTE9]|uniref:hypothetical protein n=1 Tax=Clostridium sp. (strain MSTE9) TaxID=1105031 RepID=UPI00026F2730|nr:hypothetical protein [Clostridium sp. MSTE9]EJF38167.1 hypothetical protein HMPREF1141_3334 [Clostridium sp. MSTE9]